MAVIYGTPLFLSGGGGQNLTLPPMVTNLAAKGSNATITVSWTNPESDALSGVAVVYNSTHTPDKPSDGTKVDAGLSETASLTGLENGTLYYIRVFPYNAKKQYQTIWEGATITATPEDFPAEPTSWIEIETLSDNESWVVPENGWFKFVCAAKCGNGGESMVAWDGGDPGATPPHEYWGYSGDAGGGGGYSETKVSKFKDEIIEVTFSDGSISCLGISVTAGGNGTDSHLSIRPGGAGGMATGGNITNINGETGAPGVNGNHHTGSSSGISMAATQGGLRGDGQRGGNGAGITNGNHNSPAAGVGAAAYVKIYRGNTNVPAPTTVSAMFLTPRNASIEASWTNSEDPESVGTLLVSNPTHEPQDITDGTAVDVAGATSYMLTNLPNDKPTYISLFSYNADKSKYSAAKSDVEIPREVTWYDVQEDLKEDIADAQEDAEQAQEVVLLTRDLLPDAIALTLPEIYDEWNPDGISYIGKDTATQDKPASIVKRNGSLYRCLQSHTSQESWTPENSPSLWVLIDDPAIEWPEWKQPTGAHDAYSLGAKVSHNGKKWISQIEANTVEPGTDDRYWKECSE